MGSLKPYYRKAEFCIRLCAKQAWWMLSWLFQKHSCHSSREAKWDIAPLDLEVQMVAAEDIFMGKWGWRIGAICGEVCLKGKRGGDKYPFPNVLIGTCFMINTVPAEFLPLIWAQQNNFLETLQGKNCLQFYSHSSTFIRITKTLWYQLPFYGPSGCL